MKGGKFLFWALALAPMGQLALAEDAYFKVAVTSLTFTDGKLPAEYEWKRSGWEAIPALQPYLTLEGEGEAYLSGADFQPWGPPERALQNANILVRAARGSTPTGRIFVPKSDLGGMVALTFALPVSAGKAEFREEFFKAKESHYRQLRERNIPGGAWFRHQEAEAARAHGAKTPEGQQPAFNPRRPHVWDESYDGTYEIFSGGRALSENLQLDRLMAMPGTNATRISVTNLTGITVREMDWKGLVKDLKPETDRLAAYIPFDQHALFFPSFDAISQWSDEADADGTPVVQMFEPRAEDANSRGRYQKQLCLELNELSRLVGPKLILSAAVTGSDPDLRVGTDVGVVYETKSPEVLKALIQGKQAAQTNANVHAVKGEIDGVSYTGVVSDDRSLCSYVAAAGDAVLVSNSRYQLGRLLGVIKGKEPALVSQPEYTYFRNKYPKGDKSETAFLVLSDATIRRWCSPRWRIASARRTRVAGRLAELQAAHLTELAGGTAKPGIVATNAPETGEVQLTRAGVISPAYGTPAFMTPIAETPLDQVTQAEADAYNRWKNGYQQNWSQVFDPIAVRFSLSERRLSAEVCVVPLIAGTEYRHFIQASSGAAIAPNAGDRHPEALLHLAFALNSQSQPIKESGNFLGGFSPSLRANPLGWMGECIALYADKDPFWADLAAAKETEKFFEKNYPRLPLGLYCEVKNPLGLAAFLATVRGFVEQSAPKLTTWESLDYNGQAYVKVTSQAPGDDEVITNLSVYYAATPKSLILTLSEPVLKRALDRQKAGAQAEGKAGSAPLRPWLGTNLCLQLDEAFLPTLATVFRDEVRPAQQRLSWSNLPILNEWKRLFPDQDPVKVHEQFWQTKLICPGGGKYVWNENWHTMESTVYGHPAEPKPGPDKILPLANLANANLGVTFENQGLSAKAVIERSPEKK